MTVSSWSATLRRGAFAGLALLLAAPCSAEEALRDRIRTQMGDTSYVLVEDEQGARLFVFSSDGNAEGSISFPQVHRPFSDALEKTRSSDARSRVRGLTLLAGVPGDEALNAALVLLSDPDPAVREEAVNLIIDHPDSNIETVASIAMRDPSSRVREVMEDFLDDEED